MGQAMADDTKTSESAIPTLEDWQHWTLVMGRAQQMLMEFWANSLNKDQPIPPFGAWTPQAFAFPEQPVAASLVDPGEIMSAGAQAWAKGLETWGKVLGGVTSAQAPHQKERKDRRFAAPEWQENPIFDTIRRTYLQISDQLLGRVDEIEGLDAGSREKLRFATQSFVDAMSPSNFALTNPQVLKRTLETRGENLLKGLANMLKDIASGQLTQTKPGAFEVGRNLAMTPGKVVKQTPLYQLIQYTPTTDKVLKTPVVVFPPWINRYYILDLTPAKSFVRWAVEQGISVFVVSWRSADETMADIAWDDYIRAQIEVIDHVRARLGVPSVHTIGYCVAGTTLAATLAVLARRGEDAKVASATFFTAQVDFANAGELAHFIDDRQFALIEQLSPKGYFDGRYMAATFNLLRANDLIWSYVVRNYLLGEDYPAFDLLHWNSDVTNLPARWHIDYMKNLYRDNRLVIPDAMAADGTPIDLTRVTTPAFVQAGREDHIAPPASVWKLTSHLRGPTTFMLAGSGHIAGVINPPAAGRYQYWTNDTPSEELGSLEQFVAGATEHPGSWWPYWLEWLRSHGDAVVPAKGRRKPGGRGDRAIEDAPGRYVRTR